MPTAQLTPASELLGSWPEKRITDLPLPSLTHSTGGLSS